MRVALAFCALIVGWTLLCGPALAHTKSETHSNWQVSGSTVAMTFTAPDVEVKRLAEAPGAVVSDARLAGYLVKHVGATAAGAACPLAQPPRPLSAAPGYRRVEFRFACPAAQAIALRLDAFMDLVPTHVNFAQIEPGDGPFVEQVFSRDHTGVELGGGADRLQSASFFEYVFLGVMHIFTGLDHQCFLLGMVMICRKLRDLLFVVTGFTLGHSATLALAVTGVIRPHAEYIDALVALTIVLIGVENVAVASRRPAILAIAVAALMLAMAIAKGLGLGGLPYALLAGGAIFAASYLMISGSLNDAGRLRLVVTLVFGLIHGFGFASDLLEMHLPKARLAELLVGFNLGVEIGQLSLVLGVTGGVWLLGRARLAPPRTLVVDVGSAFLVALGLYWFVSRSFGLAVGGLGG